ncbi:MAG TPA: AAA family ATPase, partial [Gemmataceae bacterium]|nr:AAA family ATPase [Gemmataceae bacterium]
RVRPGRAAVVSDEHKSLWVARCLQLDLGAHVRLHSRPFPGRRPTIDDWHDLIANLDAFRREEGLDLVVIDPLAAFLAGNESDSGAVRTWLGALRRLTATGVSVLILHHPKKKGATRGRAARGCGALIRSVDINLEMECLSRGPLTDDRRRVLCGYSPWPETPRRLIIELTADGTDYLAVGERPGPAPRTEDRDVLLQLLREAVHPLTRSDILSAWPADHPKPNEVTLWRWLRREELDGRLLRAGRGRKFHPFLYTTDPASGAA